MRIRSGEQKHQLRFLPDRTPGSTMMGRTKAREIDTWSTTSSGMLLNGSSPQQGLAMGMKGVRGWSGTRPEGRHVRASCRARGARFYSMEAARKTWDERWAGMRWFAAGFGEGLLRVGRRDLGEGEAGQRSTWDSSRVRRSVQRRRRKRRTRSGRRPGPLVYFRPRPAYTGPGRRLEVKCMFIAQSDAFQKTEVTVARVLESIFWGSEGQRREEVGYLAFSLFFLRIFSALGKTSSA